MTAKTSEHLAQVLHAAGLFKLEEKARRDEYHDFLSEDGLCAITLMNDLGAAADACPDEDRKLMIRRIMQRHMEGEFDASMEESEEWAQSPEGREAFNLLTRGE